MSCQALAPAPARPATRGEGTRIGITPAWSVNGPRTRDFANAILTMYGVCGRVSVGAIGVRGVPE